MIPLTYWCMRLLRRQVPQAAIEWMLDHGTFLQPGLDTRAPQRAVENLREYCERHGVELAGSRLCVVGYGGSFGIALALLDAGVEHVVLQDPYAPVRHHRIRKLGSERVRRHFIQRNGEWEPNPAKITVVRDDLSLLSDVYPCSMDIVYSSSVLEHVENVDGLIAACSRLTREGGLNIHQIDLRDHFFRYPFEMLCYSRKTWDRWLNSSNLNRLRLPDYERIFQRHFARHDTIITQSLAAEFQRCKPRIRREFLTGDEGTDSVGTIRIEARRTA